MDAALTALQTPAIKAPNILATSPFLLFSQTKLTFLQPSTTPLESCYTTSPQTMSTIQAKATEITGLLSVLSYLADNEAQKLTKVIQSKIWELGETGTENRTTQAEALECLVKLRQALKSHDFDIQSLNNLIDAKIEGEEPEDRAAQQKAIMSKPSESTDPNLRSSSAPIGYFPLAYFALPNNHVIQAMDAPGLVLCFDRGADSFTIGSSHTTPDRGWSRFQMRRDSIRRVLYDGVRVCLLQKDPNLGPAHGILIQPTARPVAEALLRILIGIDGCECLKAKPSVPLCPAALKT